MSRTGGQDAATIATEVGAAGVNVQRVFAGLMLGMLIASLSQTIVAPAMPIIVADLGGFEHYSWIAMSAMLLSTIVTPVVGKLSDLFGRKPFYVGGILMFVVGSILSGLSPNFWTLVAARGVQGIGMGTMMPLSQAIIGDIVSPRERGKYQGLLGGVFGIASIAGPLLGGYITDNFSWRWLFFVNIPVAIVALAFIIPFMHLPHSRRSHSIDYWGILTLSLGLTAALLATAWGGTEYPWSSTQIIGLYSTAAILIGLFIWIETRTVEPVIPLNLWRSRIFALSNLANMTVAMAMFGAIYYIPVFIQGVMGKDATGSGAILIPMTLSMIVMSVVNGFVISHTGRYKPNLLLGLAVMGSGYYLLTLMDIRTTEMVVIRNMMLVGLGLGTAMQTYTLIVQNSVGREDLGVATATTQLFRSMGATIGIAILGTLLTGGMQTEIAKRLPAGASRAGGAGELDAGAVINPEGLTRVPPEFLGPIREGIAAALHSVFLAGLPFVAVAFAATLFIKEVPLRRTVHSDAEGAGKTVLAELGRARPEDAETMVEKRSRQSGLGGRSQR